MEVSGGLDLRAGSILKMNVGSLTSDRLYVDGGDLIASAVILQLASAPGPLTEGAAVTILDWNGSIPHDITIDKFSLDPAGLQGSLRIPAGSHRLEFVAPEPGLCVIGAAATIFCLRSTRRKTTRLVLLNPDAQQ